MQKWPFLGPWVFGAVLGIGAGLSAGAQEADQSGEPNQEMHRYKVLHDFQGGLDPLEVVGLVADGNGNGNVYGSSLFGGFGDGTEFKLDRHGALTLFPRANFVGTAVGATLGPLVLDAEDSLIFAADRSLEDTGGVFRLNPHTGGLTTLLTFSGAPVDGGHAGTNVIRDSAGNLYGTTLDGGVNPSLFCLIPFFGRGCGTVYKLDANTHQETVLHTFNFDDGWQPVGLAIDKAGNLIGATQLGGDRSCRAGSLDLSIAGCGLIFRIDSSGNFSVLHQFQHTAHCPFITCPPAPGNSGPAPELLGWQPEFVAVDQDGNIFGVTGRGGNFGLGVVFEIDRFGQYSVLHHFAGPGDGFLTEQILLKDGKLYGINSDGGNTLDCGTGNGCGTLFVMDTKTKQYKVLHTFPNDEEGNHPSALAFDEDGDLIGTNLFGGVGLFDTGICTGGGGCGNVFRFTLRGPGDHDE